MKLCDTCGHSIHRGGTARTSATTCIVCQTARIMRTFHYPASQSMQALWRERKERDHDRKD